MKLRTAIFLLSIFTSFTVFSMDFHWKGNEGNWNDPTQWEEGKIPNTDSKVFVSSGKVFILKKDIITIAQLEISGGGKIDNSGKLNLSNENGIGIVLKDFANLKNQKKGTISIARTGETGIKISGNAIFLNAGKVYIGNEIEQTGKRGKEIGLHGLWMEGQSIFRNNKLLSIQNTAGKGLWVAEEAIFTNHKKVKIGGLLSLLQRHGIENEAIFTNNKKGKIYVDGTYLDAIRNISNGRFENLGKIYLGKIKSISSYGIYATDNSDFRNQEKGKVLFYTTRNGRTRKVESGKITNLGQFIEKKSK